MKKMLLMMVCLIAIISSLAQNISDVRQTAENGDAYSQYLMGWSYAKGANGLTQSYSNALPWFEKAANNGYAAAAYYLGWIYLHVPSINGGPNDALPWFEKAAKLGMPEAKEYVGRLTRTGAKGDSPRPIDDFDPSMPPILELVANSVQFVDPSGNNAIDAGENCSIRFQVINKGKGTARRCKASLTSADIVKGLYLQSKDIPSIQAGETQTITLPLYSDIDLAQGKANLFVQITEPHGFGTDPLQLSINTNSFVAPKLEVVDYAVISSEGKALTKKMPFDLQILLQNLTPGKAEDVKVSFKVPEGVVLMNQKAKEQGFTHIGGGDTKSIEYELIVNNDYNFTTIPIDIEISEKYGKYAHNKHIELELNQSLASSKIVVEEKPQESKNFDIQTASLTSVVDKNIPNGISTDSDNTFAVIIANESYNREANVPFAANDGKVFAEYCRKTFGLPETNVRLVTNATLNDMKHDINWLKQVVETRNGKARILFYYAGHGIPDECSTPHFSDSWQGELSNVHLARQVA